MRACVRAGVRALNASKNLKLRFSRKGISSQDSRVRVSKARTYARTRAAKCQLQPAIKRRQRRSFEKNSTLTGREVGTRFRLTKRSTYVVSPASPNASPFFGNPSECLLLTPLYLAIRFESQKIACDLGHGHLSLRGMVEPRLASKLLDGRCESRLRSMASFGWYHRTRARMDLLHSRTVPFW